MAKPVEWRRRSRIARLLCRDSGAGILVGEQYLSLSMATCD